MEKEFVGDKVFSLMCEINLERNFLDAKKRPMIHTVSEGHENGNSIGMFVVTNSRKVLDFIHEDIMFYNVADSELKRFMLDHSEPKKDGAMIMAETKISDNVFFSGVVSQALKNVNLTKIDDLLRVLLPRDFTKESGAKIEVGSKTRTAMSIPIACAEGNAYLIKKSAYKNVEEGTGKVVKFGKLGIEAEFYFAYDFFLPLPEEYFFDEKGTIGIVKLYNYNTVSKRIEMIGKYIVDAKMLVEGKGLYLTTYPTTEKMEYLLKKVKA